MNIVFLQAASGDKVTGPKVRVPPGNYNIEKNGSFDSCVMYLNDNSPLKVNSKLILSNHSTIQVEAEKAKNLTVRFHRSLV